ncbi:MAG: hypothetical protein H8E87_04930 [FCB group bacterium]|nr:hypothetical protein [FCB group bacterium]
MNDSSNTLIIKHIKKTDPPEFFVWRQSDGKATEQVIVQSPFGFPVEDRPNSELMTELQWYLEEFSFI